MARKRKKKIKSPLRQTKKSQSLMSQDFLQSIDKYVTTPTGGNIWEKQAALYRQKAIEPFATGKFNVLDAAITEFDKLDAQRKENLAEWKKYQEEFDDSIIYGGIENIIAPELKAINLDQREVTDMLSRISIDHKDYDAYLKRFNDNNDKVRNINKVNKTLLAIKNLDIDPSTISTQLSGPQADMWNDILMGDPNMSNNFKFIEGKLYWVNQEF